MKHKTQSYIEAVKKIKSLPKRSAKRTEAIAAASKRFNVPVRTIYHEAKKPFSKIGIKKTRKDAGKYRVKITAKEQQYFNELIESGFTKDEAKNIIEEKMNKKISSRTKTKLAKKMESEPVKDKEDASAFGSEAKQLIEKILQFEKIAEHKRIKINFKKLNINIRKKALRLIILILAGEHNLNEFKEKNKLNYDGDLLQIELMKYQLTEQMQIAFENNNLDALNKISLIQTRLMDDTANFSPNFLGMLKVINLKYDKLLTKAGLLSICTEVLGDDTDNG